MHSISTRSSGSFTVSTGGRHYVPVSAPLGRGLQHIKEIKPVPPTYVTEYEAAFTWPPNWAYATYRPPKELNAPGEKKCALQHGRMLVQYLLF